MPAARGRCPHLPSRSAPANQRASSQPGYHTHPSNVEVAVRRRAYALGPRPEPPHSAIILNTVPQPRSHNSRLQESERSEARDASMDLGLPALARVEEQTQERLRFPLARRQSTLDPLRSATAPSAPLKMFRSEPCTSRGAHATSPLHRRFNVGRAELRGNARPGVLYRRSIMGPPGAIHSPAETVAYRAPTKNRPGNTHDSHTA